MDKNTEVKAESIPPQGTSYGPYYNAREGRTFTTGKHVFHIFLYEAYNAMGLIGSEMNGIAMVSVTDTKIVFDGWYCMGMGYDHIAMKRAERDRIIAMDAKELEEFMAMMAETTTRKIRYQPLAEKRAAPKRTKRRAKLDAGIAKLPVNFYRDEEFMSAELKRRTAREFELFIVARLTIDSVQERETEYGALFRPFTRAVYNHLSMHMGYIAHYNIAGFYGAQMQATSDFVRNLEKYAANSDGAGYKLARGEGCGRYNDLNSVIVKMSKHYLPFAKKRQAVENSASEQRKDEVAMARLKRRGLVPA